MHYAKLLCRLSRNSQDLRVNLRKCRHILILKRSVVHSNSTMMSMNKELSGDQARRIQRLVRQSVPTILPTTMIASLMLLHLLPADKYQDSVQRDCS
jgi:hypothetical protein